MWWTFGEIFIAFSRVYLMNRYLIFFSWCSSNHPKFLLVKPFNLPAAETQQFFCLLANPMSSHLDLFSFSDLKMCQQQNAKWYRQRQHGFIFITSQRKDDVAIQKNITSTCVKAIYPNFRLLAFTKTSYLCHVRGKTSNFPLFFLSLIHIMSGGKSL
jgi:hypothetical protein